MSLGFRQAGFNLVCAVDVDSYSIETYRRNFGNHAICDDIRNIDGYPDAGVVIGGPPCQGFSRLGKQARKARPENMLWKEFIRCVELVMPDVFLIENVPEFLKDPAFFGVQQAASRLNYEFSWGILNAADFGVPQRRHRAFFLAGKHGKPSLPMPTHLERGAVMFNDLPPWRTVRDAISDLSLIPNRVNRHDPRNAGELALRRYKHIPPGGNRKSIPDTLQPKCWKNRKPSSGGATDLMGRLTWDSPSLTIRTQFLKPEKGCYLHPAADRSLTVREGARLQTFPDDFEFVGSNFQAAKQIGNAVPIELARQIALAVRDYLQARTRKRKRRQPILARREAELR